MRLLLRPSLHNRRHKTFDLLYFWLVIFLANHEISCDSFVDDFLQDNEYTFSLMYQVAVNVLPIQVSSVPCKHVFSSSKLTTTACQNKLSLALVKVLQILKYIFKQEHLDFSGGWAMIEADC